MQKVIQFLCGIFMLVVVNVTLAGSDKALLTVDLQRVNLTDALRIFAKFMQLNLIVSPNITGVVSLHLNHAEPNEAFDLLLASQGLTKWATGGVWFIGPQAELVTHKQDALKLQELLEDASPLVTQVWQIRYAKADDIARLLQENNTSLLSKRGHVRVDMRTNTLCIQDLPTYLAAAHAAIKQLDVPVKQVLIEARLANVDNDFESKLGVNFETNPGMATPNPHLVSANKDQSGMTRLSLALAKMADGSVLDVILSALEKEGHGELISSPSLFTANQQPASIEAGEDIPYQEVSQGGATTVAFRKAVLSLRVTPQIMPDNKVLLQLQVNQDKPSNRLVLGVPAISTRQITTSILIRNGQTIVLGGIYELNKEQGERRIPFLGKLPIIGVIFKQKSQSENKRELLIFVTPKIIS